MLRYKLYHKAYRKVSANAGSEDSDQDRKYSPGYSLLYCSGNLKHSAAKNGRYRKQEAEFGGILFLHSA